MTVNEGGGAMHVKETVNLAEEECTGCSACSVVCPCGAIAMKENEKGFISYVITDSCIGCKKCESACPIVNAENAKNPGLRDSRVIYSFAVRDEDRLRSSSGGIFYLLAKEVLKADGMVCGCIWDDDIVARHVLSSDLAGIEKMRSSKYVQSDMGSCFSEITEVLPDRLVLFSGTPCQVAGLRRLVGKCDNLLTCSFVCGGAPSPKVWREYRQAVSRALGSRITSVNMRSKDTNWLIPELKIVCEDGRVHREVLLNQNHYGVAFGSGLITMNSCTNCKFRGDALFADIVVSDHWGISREMLNRSQNKGASALLIRTQKGERLFDLIEGDIFATEGNLEDMKASHMVMCCNSDGGERRSAFIASDECDIVKRIEDGLGRGWVIKNRIVRVLNAMRLYIPFLTLRWRHRAK